MKPVISFPTLQKVLSQYPFPHFSPVQNCGFLFHYQVNTDLPVPFDSPQQVGAIHKALHLALRQFQTKLETQSIPCGEDTIIIRNEYNSLQLKVTEPYPQQMLTYARYVSALAAPRSQGPNVSLRHAQPAQTNYRWRADQHVSEESGVVSADYFNKQVDSNLFLAAPPAIDSLVALSLLRFLSHPESPLPALGAPVIKLIEDFKLLTLCHQLLPR